MHSLLSVPGFVQYASCVVCNADAQKHSVVLFYFKIPPETCALTLLLKKVNDVLGEVMYLIERLEAERQYADEALHKERKRKRFLESQIDGMSLWKQQERSQVVQKGWWCHLQPHFYLSEVLILHCCRHRA